MGPTPLCNKGVKEFGSQFPVLVLGGGGLQVPSFGKLQRRSSSAEKGLPQRVRNQYPSLPGLEVSEVRGKHPVSGILEPKPQCWVPRADLLRLRGELSAVLKMFAGTRPAGLTGCFFPSLLCA